ncbi:hypothetical protein [Photobacterium ganghwense]|uniref:hypothetical protein n=1 Tax=Photobacterium ganghwense TaxID=320778 RepID=UPI001A8C8AE9|nr:hypothetical protein [Photobacterium ganghwense]QSV13417.1 hypothetical protein FH974_11810 [Photobacterium ganghwense]
MNIFEVPKQRRYWLVRADSGRYYDHFTNTGIIALSHLNKLELPSSINGESFVPDFGGLRDDFLKLYTKKEQFKRADLPPITNPTFL